VTALRVVSLVPSVTETLLAWGVTPVACTRFCEQPDLPHVGGTKDPDVASIVALRPDVVVVDEEENRREDADALAAAGVAVHVTAVRSLTDVAPALAGLRERLGLTDDTPESMPISTSAGRPALRTFVPIWRRPWMTINRDTYGSSLLEAIGVGNVFATDATRYPETSLEEARRRRPDVVLAPSEPYPFGQRQRGELEQVAPVTFIDGRDLFWWGTRTPAAIARLREQLIA